MKLKKVVSVFLVLALFICTMPVEKDIVAATKEADYGLSNPKTEADSTTTWDCVYFGNYPQSEYTPKQAPANPISGQEYTDSDGTKMIYQEWEREEYNKEKYDYEKVKYQGYFKVEPIKWRVLSIDGEDAFLMADSILDSQCFSEKHWEDKNGNGKKEEDEIITWKDSSIRSWLNNEFYQTAFTEEERAAVLESTNENEGESSEKETHGYFLFPNGGTTQDKIFLLSREEMTNATYGMPDNAVGQFNRGSSCTDYAKKALKYESAATYWWLRSPQAYFVDDGEVSYAIMMDLDEYPVVEDYWGIRPGLHINLSDGNWEKAEAISVEAYKYKYEYTIENEKVILSHMNNGSVWLKIGDEKEEIVDRAAYGTKEAGLSRDGAYCTIDCEGQAYYGKNYDYEGDYHAIDYLKGLNGAGPWYHRTESGEIVSSCDDAENGEEAARFIYDKDNYVTGYETTKGKIVNWLSIKEMEALCDAKWGEDDDSDVIQSPAPTVKPTPVPTKTPSATPTPVPTNIPSVSDKPVSVENTKVSIKSVKNKKGKKVVASWKKVTGANGYQIAYSTNKKFKSKKAKNVTKTTVTLSKLKKKKTYYIKVRAYTKVNGKKVYGKWSAVKKVKIKR